VLSDHLQVTVSTMTTTSKRAVGDMPTDFFKFSKKGIDEVASKLNDSQGQFQFKYPSIKNKKDTFGAHFMDPDSKGDLVKTHKNCDQQYTTKVILLSLFGHACASSMRA
jgi:hypothetical protein